MALTFTLESTRYTVDLPTADFLAITRAEESMGEYLSPSLSERLEKLPGVYDVEYNGHFGAFVFLTFEAGHDTPESRAAVLDTITDQLAKAKAWTR